MSSFSLPEAASLRLPPAPESAASAREFVRAAAPGVTKRVRETAELLVSELVTNAVLHAGTEIEVRARVRAGSIEVAVGDGRPDRPLVPQCPHHFVGTGWGLALVASLTDRHGVHTDGARKWVRFEVPPAGLPPPPTRWPNVAPPPGPTVSVALIDMPVVLHSASEGSRATLLRELMLATRDGPRFGVRPEDVRTAQDTNSVINTCMIAALQDQPSGADVRSLDVAVPAGSGPSVLTLRRVLDRADDAARKGLLLTRPELPQVSAFRLWLLDQIGTQSSGGPPTAWTLVPRDPSAKPSELAPWDVSQVRASRVPTIAADDDDRIIAANKPAADLLGWHADDLVGRHLTTLIPEHLRKRHRAAFASLLLTGRPHILGRSVPLPALHRDGRTVPIRLFIQTQEAVDGRTVFVAQLTPRSAQHTPTRTPAPADEPVQPAEPEEPEETEETDAGRTPARVGPTTVLDRLWLLTETTRGLTGTPDLGEALQRVGRTLTRALADWCEVGLLDEQGRVSRIRVVHRDPERVPPDAEESPLSPPAEAAHGPLARVLHGAGPLLLTGLPAAEGVGSPLDARQQELFAQLDADNAVIAPLRVRQETLGFLTVVRGGGRPPLTEDELPLVTDLARAIALGVDNIRLYEETRNIAEHLQRSLLPVLPRVAHLQLAARYAPSSATAQVGGDWYDSFVLPRGDTVLVIGDVAGHDLGAAVAMSALRNMLRGIAIDRQEPPGEVLRRLDMANHTLAREATATCVYALVKGPVGGPWRLEHASAGHPPPLLTTSDGATRYLEDGTGLLLGMDPGVRRVHARAELPAGCTLLLYTDGLIERRGESLDQGMDRLRRKTAALARAPLEVFLDELLIGLGADNTDDIAVLALRPGR
jgi:PAS domain S-box-containing protein